MKGILYLPGVMHPQNNEHGIHVPQFLRVRLSSSCCQALLCGTCEAGPAYSTVTADTVDLLCEAGTSQGETAKATKPYTSKTLSLHAT